MTHINQRRDTAANWAWFNPILQMGEVGWERDTRKAKLGDGITPWNLLPYAVEGPAVTSVNGHTGAVILGQADVGLDNVDNTSDIDKPVSTAQQDALNTAATNTYTAAINTAATDATAKANAAKNRANHVGTQLASTISDFASSAVAAVKSVTDALSGRLDSLEEYSETAITPVSPFTTTAFVERSGRVCNGRGAFVRSSGSTSSFIDAGVLPVGTWPVADIAFPRQPITQTGTIVYAQVLLTATGRLLISMSGANGAYIYISGCAWVAQA